MANVTEVKPPALPPARHFTCEARSVGKESDRTLRFIGTDETPDRYNTIFKRDGWDFTEYRKNPVFLWHHNHDSSVPTLPIGRVVAIEPDDKVLGDGQARKGWAFTVQFTTKDENPFGDFVYRMYKGGFLSAVSVGFIGLSLRSVTSEDEQKTLGLKPGWGGVFERTELTELSAVPVPGNPNALIDGMRAFVPHLAPAITSPEKGEVMDEEWLSDKCETLRRALQVEAEASAHSAHVESATHELAPASASNMRMGDTSDTTAPEVPTPVILDVVKENRELKDALAPLFEKIDGLSREVRELREALTKRVQDPAPAAPASPPASPRAVPTDKAQRGEAKVDPLELALTENLDELRKARAACAPK